MSAHWLSASAGSQSQGRTLERMVNGNMEEKIRNLIPTLSIELEVNLEAYGENKSEALLSYFLHCNAQERAVVDNVLMYICGWTFETLLAKCGIRIGEKGDLLDAPEEEEPF